MDIRNNIEFFRKQFAGKGCKLVAVSKTHPVEKVMEAYDAGQRIFGENKVQEMCAKQPALSSDIEWHLIGHLQTNKVKQVTPFVSLIHSVDSFKLLEEINKQGKKIGRTIPCLLQVFIANEETKFGFDERELIELIELNAIALLDYVNVVGLMGMATFTEDKNQVRKEFKSLKSLSDKIRKMNLPSNIEMKELSMGMSQDYEIAIEEGSTLVRIGTAIFGSR
ncbi:MAG TPA: YggS family pyridoxal phosphate-dependent enzyme [Cyclobacteriaceae bacterium]|jgi:pyridoxal phosphate enzyme (YggS family)|nr:YggS family pyridoxal phosphate-dependent enzyme [Cyclobacteriaceae bacterium]